MKIGILGGTFNPVHIGHLILAEETRQACALDKVFFVPANVPPHKDSGDIIESYHRLTMVKLAIEENPYFAVSDMEIKRGGRSYTIDTVKAFKNLNPKDEIYFIIGSDLFKYLDEWKDLSEIIGLVKFVVAQRPGYPFKNLPSHIKTVDIHALDISGFEIRECIKKAKSIRYFVPERVLSYIEKNKLYRQ